MVEENIDINITLSAIPESEEDMEIQDAPGHKISFNDPALQKLGDKSPQVGRGHMFPCYMFNNKQPELVTRIPQ